MDQSNLLERTIALLSEHGIRFCVIGGQAVNAYAEPVVSLDLDIVVAVEQTGEAESLLKRSFRVERFPHSLNISLTGSDLRILIQTDPRYAGFVGRSSNHIVLGLELPVAALEDVLQGKVWAAQDPTRRGSKRQKDLADISRMLEEYPYLRARVPQEILDKLL